MSSRFSVLCLFLVCFFTTLISASNVTYSSIVLNGPGSDDTESSTDQVFALAVNVPDPAEDDDLYFTFRGPASSSWVAFGLGGQGEQMNGALIFVAYLAENGKNITVSPRLGTGHEEPKYTDEVEVHVIGDTYYEAGDNGGYFVEIHCTKCRSWADGNSIDINNTEQPMIFGMGPDGSIKSDDLEEHIGQHDPGSMGGFTLDLKQATGPGGLPTSNDLQEDSGSSEGFDGRSISTGLHALFMLGGFVVVLPGGFLALRVFERVWMHWAIQSVGLIIIIFGSIGGIILSKKDQISPKLTHPHQVIGLLALVLILITWAAGLMGHLSFRRTKLSRTTLPQKSHRILGPLTVAVGLINGAIGFSFAGDPHAIAGYVTVVTVMVIVVTLIMMAKRRRTMRKNAMMTPAAQNFRQGQTEGGYVPQNDEAAVPLQNYRTDYSGAVGDIRPPPPTYGEAGGYYAPPPGRPM